jgi:negative regulator of flagellin synthesis FlgM
VGAAKRSVDARRLKMEINGNHATVNLVSHITKSTELNQQDSVNASTITKQSSSRDKVELSEQAKEVNRAFEQLKELPEIREEKVGEIQNQVETGTYTVDGGKIAVSMLDEALENNAILNTIDLEV